LKLQDSFEDGVSITRSFLILFQKEIIAVIYSAILSWVVYIRIILLQSFFKVLLQVKHWDKCWARLVSYQRSWQVSQFLFLTLT